MNRVITGLIFGAVWLAILFSQSFYLLWATVTIICILAFNEYFTICLNQLKTPYTGIGIFICSIPAISAFWLNPEVVFFSFFMSIFLSALLVFSIFKDTDNGFYILTKFITGISFISLSIAHFTLTMAETTGILWLAFLTIITIASDTGAFYTGRRYGKNKLCPSISPGKTIEGFTGGLFISIVTGCFYGFIFFPDMSVIKIALLTFVLSTIGVAGDLTESILKRNNNVKDSGKLLPGHGGILDRIDSLLATAPVLFYAVHWNLV